MITASSETLARPSAALAGPRSHPRHPLARPGEAAALRWRHYDPTIRPLGKLLAAESYNTPADRSEAATDAEDPVVAELEVALAMRLAGADAKALRRARRRIEELLDE